MQVNSSERGRWPLLLASISSRALRFALKSPTSFSRCGFNAHVADGVNGGGQGDGFPFAAKRGDVGCPVFYEVDHLLLLEGATDSAVDGVVGGGLLQVQSGSVFAKTGRQGGSQIEQDAGVHGALVNESGALVMDGVALDIFGKGFDAVGGEVATKAGWTGLQGFEVFKLVAFWNQNGRNVSVQRRAGGGNRGGGDGVDGFF